EEKYLGRDCCLVAAAEQVLQLQLPSRGGEGWRWNGTWRDEHSVLDSIDPVSNTVMERSLESEVRQGGESYLLGKFELEVMVDFCV
nr:hypothetical protein [Escherichia coli]